MEEHTPTIHIALLIVELRIPEAQSLKGKRKVISSIKDRIRSKFNASVAELGQLDKWQRSICGVAMIGNDERFLNKNIDAVLSLIESVGDIQLLDSRIEFL